MTRPVEAGSVVPAFLDRGEWSASFGESFVHLMLHDLNAEQRCFRGGAYLREMASAMGLADARNHVTQVFLDETAGEWLWFVDTDMGFEADTVDRLVAAADPVERPVMGGLCFAQRRTGRTELRAERYASVATLYRWIEQPRPEGGVEVGFAALPDWPRGEVVEVGGTGAACLLIHRSVLVDLRARHGDEWFSTIRHPHGLGTGQARTFSEDLSFCVRLAGAGFRVHVDTSVRTSHHKGGVYLDEANYDHERALAGV